MQESSPCVERVGPMCVERPAYGKGCDSVAPWEAEQTSLDSSPPILL